jgi:hypothetical protein
LSISIGFGIFFAAIVGTEGNELAKGGYSEGQLRGSAVGECATAAKIHMRVKTLFSTNFLKRSDPNTSIFGHKVGLIGKLFGCRHENLSRPFSQNNVTYRSCLDCGARRQFDGQTLQTFGAFYYPPIVKEECFM